ncbi:hypothetical protein VNO80_17887 [Phaseolus coccineus]|uniref:Uncharacterized protein n=1 Tax=Phaseolus coccineus TaxID=3886 RepID=A0AAN9MD55_PHACN
MSGIKKEAVHTFVHPDLCCVPFPEREADLNETQVWVVQFSVTCFVILPFIVIIVTKGLRFVDKFHEIIGLTTGVKTKEDMELQEESVFALIPLISPLLCFFPLLCIITRKEGKKSEMVISTFNGTGVGFGFGVGCGFGIGWGFGGMPLNLLGLGAGGGCGVGVGLGWGFGTAFGSKYRSSRITFQGVEFDSKETVNRKEFSKPSTEAGGAR